jgi:uncharacterized protein YbaP (TraB family)
MEDRGASCRSDGIRRIAHALLVGTLLVGWSPITPAQSPISSSSNAPPAITLSTVVVHGVLPGPALWKVSKGNHVMWILGVVSPVPKNMQWKFDDIDKRIASSQAVLKLPGMEVGTHLSVAHNAALMSSIMALRDNPHGRRLQTVLTPVLYHRWHMQKDRYFPMNYRVEYMRPIFAGRELYDAALERKGLVDQQVIEKTVYDAAAHHGVPIVDPAYQVALDDPDHTIDALKKTGMDDQRCLRLVLDAIDGDLAQATTRANAWATGDIDSLKQVLMQTQEDECLSAVATSPFATLAGMTDMQQRIDQAWIAQAEQALEQNTQTVALLPMEQLYRANGYLSALQAKGYTVQVPTE